jgi:dynein heavy chain
VLVIGLFILYFKAVDFFLLSFIRLADYLIVNTMHVLAVHSVLTLLNHLKDQLNNTPTLELIQSFAEEAKHEAEMLDKDPEEVC